MYEEEEKTVLITKMVLKKYFAKSACLFRLSQIGQKLDKPPSPRPQKKSENG